jgi:hypothetical protein
MSEYVPLPPFGVLSDFGLLPSAFRFPLSALRFAPLKVRARIYRDDAALVDKANRVAVRQDHSSIVLAQGMIC